MYEDMSGALSGRASSHSTRCVRLTSLNYAGRTSN